MTKRIFHAICLAALGVFLACITLFMCVLYEYFSNVQAKQLKIQTDLAAQAVANEGIDYFDGLNTAEYRITWIGPDGTVLYDSKSASDEMENHLEREEVKEALSNGSGESFRYSNTLMERALYAAKRLPDGTVIRLSASHNAVLTLLLGMSQPICIIIVIALVLSLVLAYRLSKQIVKPLNELNLDEPLKNNEYDELAPLLRRINAQQRQIRLQSEELRQKQSEFETVTRGMAEGIVLLNRKMDIIAINSAASKLFHTSVLCIGKSILSVNRSLDLQSVLLKAEGGQHAEMRMDIDGWKYQLTASPVFSDGLVSGIVLLLLNVTEQENAEQMRREFTANVSHELKTPLHTIAGSAELLAGGMVKDSDLMGFYTRIHDEALRMIHLIEDIIRLSHLDEGADDMKREEVDLFVLAGETVKVLSPAAENGHITVTLNGEPAVITGIPQLLQSIVYNLCDNAIKYNRQYGGVTVTGENQADYVILSVADTGIGIPSEHQERIFERFYRVDKSRSKELGGTGLGLSIVKHAARLHGANIELQSVVDGGTTVTVSFPKGANK